MPNKGCLRALSSNLMLAYSAAFPSKVKCEESTDSKGVCTSWGSLSASMRSACCACAINASNSGLSLPSGNTSFSAPWSIKTNGQFLFPFAISRKHSAAVSRQSMSNAGSISWSEIKLPSTPCCLKSALSIIIHTCPRTPLIGIK